MKRSHIFKLLGLLLILQFNNHAQGQHGLNNSDASKNSRDQFDKNIIKLNLTSALLRNYGFQYERLLSRHISVAVGFSYMSNGKIPHLSALKTTIDDDDTYQHLQNIQIGAITATPEFRFYLSKKSGARGFYIAPFARYSKYDLNFNDFDYASQIQSEEAIEDLPPIDLKGSVTGITGGLMFGAQWRLGKLLYLDWWIAGGGYGKADGKLVGTASLSEEAQEALKTELDALELPLVKSTAEVDANGGRLLLNGPWVDLRAGILIGIKF